MTAPPVDVKPAVILPPLSWRASPNHSDRFPGSAVTMIVCHDTEGSYAGSVDWLCNPKAQASAHVVLDEFGREATQLVAWNSKAWACVAFNSVSDNIEMAHVSGQPWRWEQLRAMGRIVAYRLKRRGLPCRYIGTRTHLRGYTRHKDLGFAGGGHTDPSMNAMEWRFLRACIWYEYHRGHFRPSWGR